MVMPSNRRPSRAALAFEKTLFMGLSDVGDTRSIQH
jgi:hypothetical protein